MGAGTILDAKEVVLSVVGPRMKNAVPANVEGGANLSVSSLQLHYRALVLLDQATAELLVHI